MEHQIIINTNSFPADSIQNASCYFNSALQGVLALNTGADSFTFYLDSNNIELSDFNLAEGFTYENFVSQTRDQDFKLFLLEIQDKSPAIDTLTEDQLEEMPNDQFYIPDQPVVNYPDVFSFSWVLSGILLSIPTSDVWKKRKINIRRTAPDGQFIQEDLWINNISCFSHGTEINEQFSNNNLYTVCNEHHITNDLIKWYDDLRQENKRRVLDKLSLACERNFVGGEPLFKSLINQNGIREVRFSAYPGGAIRVLFKVLSSGNQALLVGFIKKNDSDGYDTAIGRATNLFQEIP